MNVKELLGLKVGRFLCFKKKVTKSYRKGRKYRVQQIVRWENERLKVKTIIHQMY